MRRFQRAVFKKRAAWFILYKGAHLLITQSTLNKFISHVHYLKNKDAILKSQRPKLLPREDENFSLESR